MSSTPPGSKKPHQSIFHEDLEETQKEQPLRRTLTKRLWRSKTDTTSIELQDITGAKNLKAARSETWPWGVETPSESAARRPGTEIRRESYLEVLHSASKSGVPPPARHEIHTYQRKSLPPIPETATTGPQSTLLNPKPSEIRPIPAEVESSPGRGVEQSDKTKARSEMVTEDRLSQVPSFMTGKKKPTWLSRVEKREENNQKAREMLDRD